jgi:hypothetical protein
MMAPRKGSRKSNPEPAKTPKFNLDLNGDTTNPDSERQLRKTTIAQRYPFPSKGKATAKLFSSVHNHKQPEVIIFQNPLVISPQTSHVSNFASSSPPSTTPTTPPQPQSLVVPNMVVNRMEAIITTRYAPLVFP